MKEFNRNRLIEGAKHYAQADKSDPFAFDRAMCHITQGICSFTQDGGDGHYSADPYMEERLTPDGKPYMATVYRNIKRP